MRTIAWIIVLVFIPVAGLLFYVFFGQNFRKKQVFKRKRKADAQEVDRLASAHDLNLPVEHYLDQSAVKNNLQLIRMLQSGSKSRLSFKNRVEILRDGAHTYAAILEALQQAQSFIHLEYYIFEEGTVAEQVKAILIEKVRSGVEVRFIYDGVGSWGLSDTYLEQLEEAGVMVFSFRSVRFPSFTSKLNYRNHRKIVIVDGHIGFLGGINISDKLPYTR